MKVQELQLIYEAKGLTDDMAKELSKRLVSDPRNALDVLTREEFGLDPQELGGSARVAALTSFLLFSLGIVIPVARFFLFQGQNAVLCSLGTSSLVLFAIGTVTTIFTGRPVLGSGFRQLCLWLAAAGITFALGKAFGVALGNLPFLLYVLTNA